MVQMAENSGKRYSCQYCVNRFNKRDDKTLHEQFPTYKQDNNDDCSLESTDPKASKTVS